MKSLLILIFCISSSLIYSQETTTPFDGHKWEAPYNFSIPKDWTIERFLIPISFAPSIPYKGVEDIRFTPGWAMVTSDDYWSYIFLWYLDGKVTMESKKIEENLKAYYTGLVQVNGANIPKEKIIPVETSFKEIKADAGDIKTFTGTVKMLDYMQQKPITLNCKIHIKTCPGSNKTFVFHELSPQAFGNKIWSELDKLCADFKCAK